MMTCSWYPDTGLDGTEGPAGYSSETGMSMYPGATSRDKARSTLAEALTLPTRITEIFTGGSCGSDNTEPAVAADAEGLNIHELCSSSRAMTNHVFLDAYPYNLPKDHPTISLNSEQIHAILRVVADESARASYAMMEDTVERTSRLSL